MQVRAFLRTRVIALSARSRRLSRIDYASTGIRPQDLPYAPSPVHFQAANERLASIDRQIARRLQVVEREWTYTRPQRVLIDIAMVEREIDRARRAFGMFFEVFSQRGSNFAPVLAAHDAIAEDCYAAVREAAPRLLSRSALPPVTYLEHGYSPATKRRGAVLARLLGESNPFPVIRIPWDRDNPWQTVFLHECAHNLQADIRVWQENRNAVVKRVATASGDPMLAGIYGRWHKEIFADMAALLLGGPAAAWGMALFLMHPAPRMLTYRHGGVHPTGYLRVLILTEMLRRMGFGPDAARLEQVWRKLFDPVQGQPPAAPPARHGQQADAPCGRRDRLPDAPQSGAPGAGRCDTVSSRRRSRDPGRQAAACCRRSARSGTAAALPRQCRQLRARLRTHHAGGAFGPRNRPPGKPPSTCAGDAGRRPGRARRLTPVLSQTR